jgi:hypothetical protein
MTTFFMSSIWMWWVPAQQLGQPDEHFAVVEALAFDGGAGLAHHPCHFA